MRSRQRLKTGSGTLGIKGKVAEKEKMYQRQRRDIRKEVQELLQNMTPRLSHNEDSPSFDIVYVNNCISNGLEFDGSSNSTSDLELISSNELEKANLAKQLKIWSLQNNITHSALSELLQILIPYVSCPLPKCSKTHLATPRVISIVEIGGGKLYNFGLQKIVESEIINGLIDCDFPLVRKLVSEFNTNEKKMLTLSVSTDGIPIGESNGVQFWPILIRLDQGKSREPRLVSLFRGENKPSSISEFFKYFVEEVKFLQDVGFTYNSVQYFVKISAVIADAPARSFVKAVKGHTGYHSCERCEEEGDYLENRIVFLGSNANLRTDISFINKVDSDHHIGNSPLIDLNLGLVSQVVLDYMHLICLGVMRKLFYIWEKGALPNRLPSREWNKLSDNLVSVSKFVPSEFTRKPRGLKHLHRYKATEFRQFLLYVGPVVLKPILSTKLYKHFLLLHSATFILLSNKSHLPLWNEKARSFLKIFVDLMGDLYGISTMSYNVHSLLHVADDSLNYGNLDNVSAFPFENYLQKLKRMVRGKTRELEQVVKRVTEKESFNFLTSNRSKFKPKIRNDAYVKIYTKTNIVITCNKGDNVFLLSSGEIVKVTEILSSDSLMCQVFVSRKVAKYYPLDSSELMIVIIDISKLSLPKLVSLDEIIVKYVFLPIPNNQNFFCIPMVKMSLE